MLFLLLACTTSSENPNKKQEEVVDCSARPLEIPSPRGEIGGAWDEGHGRFVFFGGDEGVPEQCSAQTSFSGETWAFQADCGNFVKLEPAEAPEDRGRYAMATDALGGQLLLHGGRTREGTSGKYTLFEDLWSFDFNSDSWTQLSGKGPSARTNHGMAVANNRLILYGGNSSTDGASFTPLEDVWAFDLDAGSWEELKPSGRGPGGRLFHAVAASDDGKHFYVYGGGDENAFFGPFFGDLYDLDLDTLTWTLLSSGGRNAPASRIWATLHYDGAHSRLLMVGGHDDGALGNTNQVWAFDLNKNSWTELREGDVQNADANGFCDFPADFVDADLESPERRDAHAADLTPDGQLYLFGGKTDCGIINDLWTLDVESVTWTERSPATYGEACVRAAQQCESLCY